MSLEEKLLSRITASPSGCWNWNGPIPKRGYARLEFNGKTLLVHRVAAHLWLKLPLDSELQVLHKCDNPRCFNPKHLFVGTSADNNLDMISKGRAAWQKMTHCGSGRHLWITENIREAFTGKRECKICRRERVNKRRALQRLQEAGYGNTADATGHESCVNRYSVPRD